MKIPDADHAGSFLFLKSVTNLFKNYAVKINEVIKATNYLN